VVVVGEGLGFSGGVGGSVWGIGSDGGIVGAIGRLLEAKR
jgi:hypothetical protein